MRYNTLLSKVSNIGFN